MFARTEELAAKFERDQREVEMLKAVHEYAAPGWGRRKPHAEPGTLNLTVRVGGS